MVQTLVDARDLRCPMPLLKLKQAIASVEPGDLIELVSTDIGSWRDIPAYIELTNHILIEQSEISGEYWFLVNKGEVV